MVQNYVPPPSQSVVNPSQPTPSHIPNTFNLQTPPSQPLGGSNIQYCTPPLDPNFGFTNLDDWLGLGQTFFQPSNPPSQPMPNIPPPQSPPKNSAPNMNMSKPLGALSNISKPNQSTQSIKLNTSHNIQGSSGPSIEEMQNMIDHM